QRSCSHSLSASQHAPFFLFVSRRPSRSPLFPYTTLFRSCTTCTRSATPSRSAFLRASATASSLVSVAQISTSGLLTARATAIARSEDTRLNSSHSQISYAVFCLKKKKKNKQKQNKSEHRL